MHTSFNSQYLQTPMDSSVIALLVLAACSGAWADTSLWPRYIESQRSIQDSLNTLNKFIDHVTVKPSFNETIRHSIVVASVIQKLVVIYAEHCVANDSYEKIVDDAIIASLDDPVTAVDEILHNINKMNAHREPITSLINDFCNPDEDDTACDAIVDTIVNIDPDMYKHAAEVVIAAGKAANVFNFQAGALMAIAELRDEIRYFLQAEQSLTNLISLLVYVHQLVNNLPQCN